PLGEADGEGGAHDRAAVGGAQAGHGPRAWHGAGGREPARHPATASQAMRDRWPGGGTIVRGDARRVAVSEAGGPGLAFPVPVMKATLGPLPAGNGRWAYEVKWDGMRIVAFIA